MERIIAFISNTGTVAKEPLCSLTEQCIGLKFFVSNISSIREMIFFLGRSLSKGEKSDADVYALIILMTSSYIFRLPLLRLKRS